MADEFQGALDPEGQEDLQKDLLSNDEIIKEIEAENEKDYLQQLSSRNKNFLVKLDLLERERVAQYLIDRYNESLEKHNDLCDKLDGIDAVYRMERESTADDDGELPNYRSPLSAVTVEVVHSNIMNVFFTPKDIVRVLPTEQNDVSKVGKLAIFSNWSVVNELNIFEQCDRLFHSSAKNGECPYMMHWVKEYGVEIKREPLMNPLDQREPLIDPETKEPLFQEIEIPKLLYNGPKLEVFSRKDYGQPPNAVMDYVPEYEWRHVRMTYDKYLRMELEGKAYKGSIKDIKDWGGNLNQESTMIDHEGDTIPIGAFEKQFVEFYLRMRVNVVKADAEDDIEEKQELEDEFIAIIHVESGVLCQLRKNKFPLKQRPIGIDYFMPDDEGRRAGTGIIETMDGAQSAYDALFNQYIYGTTQANNPFGFFSPTGNQRDEPLKIKNGYLYPTSDPNSINIVKLPQPDSSLDKMMEIVRYWSQLLFGISDYSAGLESTVDPSAPAKKAEIVVAQGSVRLNLILKRKVKTLRDILRRWFLLYKENMPPNKFMRVTGDDKDNPWKFEAVSLSDFALKSLPDFELTGNILEVNKSLKANKAMAVYNLLAQNFFFQPQTQQGLQALYALTKWLMEQLDETGISRFLPKVEGEEIQTPEEENARMLQGDEIEPTVNEDHPKHIQVHIQMVQDQTIPNELKNELLIPHIQKHQKMMTQILTQQMMAKITGQISQPNQGEVNGQPRTGPESQAPQGVLPGQPAGMAGPQGRPQQVPF